MTAEQICINGAPAYIICTATSAESIPPVAIRGIPGIFLAIAEIARKAKGRTVLPHIPPYVILLLAASCPTPQRPGLASVWNPVKPETVLMAVTPSTPPSRAACAMTVISVTLGVSLANTGIVEASTTHEQALRTLSGYTPNARPMPFSCMPCGQDKFISIMSDPASQAIRVISCQLSFSKLDMMDATTTRSGKRRFNSRIPLHQYSAVFSEMSSMLMNPS
mmetsp:Transcript_4290/g.8775  ORF Transcript_4290/g.8775 Transcript_4290/m.8775 type:complete len:221 (+) Transcript_4290:460-1122(+)